MFQAIQKIIKNSFALSGNKILTIEEKLDTLIHKVAETTAVNKGMQILLSLKYKELLARGTPLPQFEDVELRAFSQNGEDGILLYIFSLIGTTNKNCVELCAADGIECNTANLIINHGWSGLLFDGDEQNISRGKSFYSNLKDTFIWPPKLVKSWINAENVNSLILSNGFEGEIDLLSLDLDGVDYWIWKAIDCINPRVVVLEYQDILGSEKAVTVPYEPNFKVKFNEIGFSDYYGASLSAFIKLGKEKGYRLVGCQRYGFNAFFIRSGVGEDIFPETIASQYFQHPKVKSGIENRLPKILDREWVQV